MRLIIFLLLALFGVNAFAVNKFETTEIDFERDAFVKAIHEPLPEPEYPQEYRTIPENDEIFEQPDSSNWYYEEFDVKHTECIRMNDKLMRCPASLKLTPDEEIVKEMSLDEHYHSCEKKAQDLVLCKRGKR